ncbi:MAG: hypothetical protein LCH53_13570 [Bacteroidetes bacterium]|nr:hypothetical protein [Bacteroidota bacterium]
MDAAPKLRLRLDRRALLLAGQFAVTAIVERTARGEDADGKPFVPYSTRPLALPVGSPDAKTIKALLSSGQEVSGNLTKRAIRKLRKAEDGLYYFTSRRTGALWMVIEGGYAAVKAARYPKDGGVVNLHATGSMMRALRVIGVDATVDGGGTVTVGFSRPEEAQKAYWNSRTRRFLGLTSDEQAEAGRIVGEGVTVEVR